jgi:cellulose synthase/poly-beta-1,6-N-acetylglucosamine synthase-like glycosyltransferase
VADKVRACLALDYPPGQMQLVVACDGCRDETAAELGRLHGLPLKVLAFAERRGKAACINDALAAVDCELAVMVDLRQRIDRAALHALVAQFGDPGIGAVSGELCFEAANGSFAQGIDGYWRYEKFLRLHEARSGSVVGVTGALYALRVRAFQPIPSGTILDDVLIPMQLAQRGWRIGFEPAAIAWDSASQQPRQERARKVRTLAGNFQLVQLCPSLLLPWRNPLWFRFVSHKLLRLAGPWLILAMAAAALLAARQQPLYLLPAAAIGACLVAALVARHCPSIGRWAPLRVASAFVYLNLFCAEALFAFLRNRRLHLW